LNATAENLAAFIASSCTTFDI